MAWKYPSLSDFNDWFDLDSWENQYREKRSEYNDPYENPYSIGGDWSGYVDNSRYDREPTQDRYSPATQYEPIQLEDDWRGYITQEPGVGFEEPTHPLDRNLGGDYREPTHPLREQDDDGFMEWYTDWARKTGLSQDPDDPRHQYDYRAAYRAGATPQLGQDGTFHWPSEFKAPGHPNRFVGGQDTITGRPAASEMDRYMSDVSLQEPKYQPPEPKFQPQGTKYSPPETALEQPEGPIQLDDDWQQYVVSDEPLMGNVLGGPVDKKVDPWDAKIQEGLDRGTTAKDWFNYAVIGAEEYNEDLGRTLKYIDPVWLTSEALAGLGDVFDSDELKKKAKTVSEYSPMLSLEKHGRETKQQVQNQISPAARALQEASIFNKKGGIWDKINKGEFGDIFSEQMKSPTGVAKKIAQISLQSGAQSAGGMGMGMALTKNIINTGFKYVPKIISNVLIKKFGESAAAGIVGGAVGEGTTAGISNAYDSFDEIMATKPERIKESDIYKKIVTALPDAMEEKRKDTIARTALAYTGSALTGLLTAFSTGILGAPSGAVVGKIIGGESKGFFRNALKSGLSEALVEEGPQSGVERVLQNAIAKTIYDKDRKVSDGVLEAIAQGMAGGFGMGAALGGGASIGSAEKTTTEIPEYEGETALPKGHPAELLTNLINGHENGEVDTATLRTARDTAATTFPDPDEALARTLQEADRILSGTAPEEGAGRAATAEAPSEGEEFTVEQEPLRNVAEMLGDLSDEQVREYLVDDEIAPHAREELKRRGKWQEEPGQAEIGQEAQDGLQRQGQRQAEGTVTPEQKKVIEEDKTLGPAGTEAVLVKKMTTEQLEKLVEAGTADVAVFDELVKRNEAGTKDDVPATAALRLNDGTIVIGETHGHAYSLLTEEEKQMEPEPGWHTESGRFMDEKEAKDKYGSTETNAIQKKAAEGATPKSAPVQEEGGQHKKQPSGETPDFEVSAAPINFKKDEKKTAPVKTTVYRGAKGGDKKAENVWYTSDEDAAKEYAAMWEDGQVRKADISLENPAGIDDVRRVAKTTGHDDSNRSAWELLSPESYYGAEETIKKLKEEGFDGVHLPKGEDFTESGREIESFMVFGEKADEKTIEETPDFEVSTPSLDSITKKWTDKGIKLEVFEDKNGIKLDDINVPADKRKGGIGTQAVQDIIDYADQAGQKVRLTPAVKSDLKGTTSRKRLVDFYKRFGFVENRGKNKDFSIREGMYREAEGPDFEATQPLEWKKSAVGGFVATAPTGERLTITPKAFGSKKARLRGDGAIGKSLFDNQFYDSVAQAKKAAEKALADSSDFEVSQPTEQIKITKEDKAKALNIPQARLEQEFDNLIRIPNTKITPEQATRRRVLAGEILRRENRAEKKAQGKRKARQIKAAALALIDKTKGIKLTVLDSKDMAKSTKEKAQEVRTATVHDNIGKAINLIRQEMGFKPVELSATSTVKQLKKAYIDTMVEAGKRAGERVANKDIAELGKTFDRQYRASTQATGVKGQFLPTYDADGAVIGGEWIVYADKITSMKDLETNALHEVLGGHAAFKMLFGAEYDAKMDELYGLLTDKQKAAVDQYGIQYGYAEEKDGKVKFKDDSKRRRATEEYLAYTAGKGERNTAVQKFLSWIREYLRKIFPDLKLSDAEIRRLIAKARGVVETGVQGEKVSEGEAELQVAYHGTPHIWPPEKGFPHGRPRLDKIGTGEGAAAYGHGWYSADVDETAKSYMRSGESAVLINGNPLSNRKKFQKLSDADKLDVEILIRDVANGTLTKNELFGYAAQIRGNYLTAYNFIRDAKSIGYSPTESLYKLDIPDPVIPKLLDWDKPLSEQSEYVKKALKTNGMFVEKDGKWYHRVAHPSREVKTGKDVYGQLEGARQPFDKQGWAEQKKNASSVLRSIGIPGNKYLDQMSRGKGDGSFNYVIWDQDVLDQIALLERNGEKLDAIRKVSEGEAELQVDAWHGSPHDIKKSLEGKFSTKYIGTGEGATAFGWGLYFTDLKGIAEHYANMARRRHEPIVETGWKIGNKVIKEGDSGHKFSTVLNNFASGLTKDKIKKDLQKYHDDVKPIDDKESSKVFVDSAKEWAKQAIEFADSINEKVEFWSQTEPTPKRNLYKVTIHKGKQPSEYTWLDWYSGHGEQPAKTKKILDAIDPVKDLSLKYQNVKGWHGYVNDANKLIGQAYRSKEELEDWWNVGQGKRVYQHLIDALGSKKEASLFLLKKGIDGIRYPAESLSGRRGEARGNNYVVFDENAIEIEDHVVFEFSVHRQPLDKAIELVKGNPKFQKWFKGSKVVDENGDPMVVYHGTAQKFTQFSDRFAGSNTYGMPSSSLGFFFTSAENEAPEYGRTVMPVFLSLKNPYISNLEELSDLDQPGLMSDNLFSREDILDWRKELQDKGHDGIIFEDVGGDKFGKRKYIVSFRPNQIKSVFNKEFSESDDIMFEMGGKDVDIFKETPYALVKSQPDGLKNAESEAQDARLRAGRPRGTFLFDKTKWSPSSDAHHIAFAVGITGNREVSDFRRIASALVTRGFGAGKTTDIVYPKRDFSKFGGKTHDEVAFKEHQKILSEVPAKLRKGQVKFDASGTNKLTGQPLVQISSGCGRNAAILSAIENGVMPLDTLKDLVSCHGSCYKNFDQGAQGGGNVFKQFLTKARSGMAKKNNKIAKDMVAFFNKELGTKLKISHLISPKGSTYTKEFAAAREKFNSLDVKRKTEIWEELSDKYPGMVIDWVPQEVQSVIVPTPGEMKEKVWRMDEAKFLDIINAPSDFIRGNQQGDWLQELVLEEDGVTTWEAYAEAMLSRYEKLTGNDRKTFPKRLSAVTAGWYVDVPFKTLERVAAKYGDHILVQATGPIDFTPAEAVLRLRGFKKLHDAGLTPVMRLITDEFDVGGKNLNHKDSIKKTLQFIVDNGIRPDQILETPLHYDSPRLSNTRVTPADEKRMDTLISKGATQQDAFQKVMGKKLESLTIGIKELWAIPTEEAENLARKVLTRNTIFHRKDLTLPEDLQDIGHSEVGLTYDRLKALGIPKTLTDKLRNMGYIHKFTRNGKKKEGVFPNMCCTTGKCVTCNSQCLARYMNAIMEGRADHAIKIINTMHTDDAANLINRGMNQKEQMLLVAPKMPKEATPDYEFSFGENEPNRIAQILNRQIPDHDIRFDGVWKLPKELNRPDLYQFTPYSGPFLGRTFTVTEPTVDAIKEKLIAMDDTAPDFEIDYADVWYSQMERSLAKLLPGSGSVKQIKQNLESWASPPNELTERISTLEAQERETKNEPESEERDERLEKIREDLKAARKEAGKYKGEFKREELEWSELNEWLDSKKGKVTKQEILDYLAENNVRVEEVVKGEQPSDFNIGISQDDDGTWSVWDGDTLVEDGIVSEAEASEIADTHEGTARMDFNRPQDDTRWGPDSHPTLTQPGGKSYRELLITLPVQKDELFRYSEDGAALDYIDENGIEIGDDEDPVEVANRHIRNAPGQEAFTSSHWPDDPNVLVHIRFDERTDSQGRRVLHVAEVQSDIHQKGRKHGYKPKDGKGYDYWSDEVDRLWGELSKEALPPKEQGRLRKEWNNAVKERDKYRDQIDAVPDMPFKQSREWSLLAMKRMVRYAAENGFDAVTWDSGIVQVKRYEDATRQQVDSIRFWHHEGGYGFDAEKNGRTVYQDDSLSEDKLTELLGKGIAGQIIERKRGTIEGDDLTIGGEGMKGFYDSILPNALNKFFNKKAWGRAKVGTAEIEIPSLQSDASNFRGEPIEYGVVDDSEIDSELSTFSVWAGEDLVETFDTRAEAEAYVNRHQKKYTPEQEVWSLSITPEMRSKALHEGMPLFELSKADQQRILDQLRGMTGDEIKKAQKNIQDAIDIGKKQKKMDPQPKPSEYEAGKDSWFAEKDWAKHYNSVQARYIQENIREAIGEKKFGDKAKDIDQAIHIYLDTKRNPEHIDEYYDSLTKEQKRIVDLSKTIEKNPKLKKIADYIDRQYVELGERALDSEVIHNVLENYVGRAWKVPEDKKGNALNTDTLQKFKTTSRHAKQRVFETILEGWTNGYDLQVKGASNSLNLVKDEIARTIEDKKLIKTLLGLKDKDGNPILSSKQETSDYVKINHPNFTHSVPRLDIKNSEETKKYGGDFWIDTKFGAIKPGADRAAKVFNTEEDAKAWVAENGGGYNIRKKEIVMQKTQLYAPSEVAKSLNKILDTSALKGKMRLGKYSVIDVLTKYNAVLKSTILATSFFHHIAFMNSYILGTRRKKMKEWNPIASYKDGLNAINSLRPEVELLVRNGLTLGRMQDWEEHILRNENTVFGVAFDKIAEKTGIENIKKFKDWVNELRERQANFLFQRFGAGLKVKAALIEYRNALKEHPEMDPNDRAKMVANLINDDFGGLHLQRMERSQTGQHIFRLFALAPDWTESNIRSMYKMFLKGGPEGIKDVKAQKETYRRFWASVITKGFSATILANLMLAAFDDDDFWKRYKKAWDEGHLRWLEVDITPIYRLLPEPIGGKTNARKYFTLIGHFKDPFKFVSQNPAISAHHKGSVLYKTVFELMAGKDWKGQRFTTLAELLGIDDKGYYVTTRKGKYKAGDPKGGKLAGQLTTYKPGPTGRVTYQQTPSYIISQLRNFSPVQFQNLVAALTGEAEWFESIAKSLGLKVSSTYPNKRRDLERFSQEYINRIGRNVEDLKKEVAEYNKKADEDDQIKWESVKKKGDQAIKIRNAALSRIAGKYSYSNRKEIEKEIDAYNAGKPSAMRIDMDMVRRRSGISTTTVPNYMIPKNTGSLRDAVQKLN